VKGAESRYLRTRRKNEPTEKRKPYHNAAELPKFSFRCVLMYTPK
jgi:hypothetical protein